MFKKPTLPYVLSFLVIITSGLQINKCCSDDQGLDTSYECANVTEYSEEEDAESIENGLDVMSWFPVEALINGSTLKPMTEESQRGFLKWLAKNNLVQYGVRPHCEHPNVFKGALYYEDYKFFRVAIGGKTSGVYMTNPKVISGSISYQVDVDEMWFMPISAVCFDTISGIHQVVYCPGSGMPWMRKCCPPRHIFNTSSGLCERPVTEITDWKPNVDRNMTYVLLSDQMPDCENRGLAYGVKEAQRCRGLGQSNNRLVYLSNGSVWRNNRLIHTQQYCGEKTWHDGDHIIHHNLIVCAATQDQSATRVTYGVIFFVGGACLLVTVVISLMLPELRRRTHNKIALTHNISLMVAYFAWGSSQVIDSSAENHLMQCIFLSLVIQASFLGSLFWLNAMCIDMSSTFRTTQTVSSRSYRSETRRYIIYSLYAWGFTAVISLFTIIMENVDKPPPGLIRPGLSCYCGFVRHTWSILVYFYGPMALLLLFNLVLYVFTTWKIISVQRQTTILHHTNSNTSGRASGNTDKQRLILYTKLFLLMGLTWVTEIIGWAVSGDSFFWFVLDVINLLRAVFIFVLFICKKTVLSSLRNRIYNATGRLGRHASSTKSQTENISLGSTPSSRKTSREEVVRKRSRDQENRLETLPEVSFKELETIHPPDKY